MQKKYSNIAEEEAEEELYLEEEERYTPMSQRWGDTSSTSHNGKKKTLKTHRSSTSATAKSEVVLVSSEDDMDEEHRLHDAIIQDYINDLEQNAMTEYHHTIVGGDRKWRTKKRIRTILILLATVIIVLLLCTAGVTFFIQNYNNPNEEIPHSTTSSHYNNETLSSSIHYYQVPLPPSDLDVTCSISNVETPEGYSACQLSCDPASCCLSTLQNCRWNNQPICDMYDTCMLLSAYTGMESNLLSQQPNNNMMNSTTTTAATTTSSFTLPDAPSNIESLCSPTNRQTRNGSIQCDEICRNAACCQSSCSTSPQCINYQVCFTTDIGDYMNHSSSSGVGSNNDTIVLVEELDIASLCDDFRNPKCIQKCQERQCCFTSFNSCYTEYTTWCDTYAICKDLPLWEAVEQQFHTNENNETTDNIQSTSEFQQKCSMYLSTTDLDECLKLCEERSCCFTTDGCGIHTDTLCHESFECINLPNFEEFYNKAHGNSSSTTSAAAAAATTKGTLEPFTISTTTSTTDISATSTTTTSGSSEPVDASVKATVDFVCSSTAIAINGTQGCEDICKERSCCFISAEKSIDKSDASISEPSCANNPALKGWCEEYSACQVLLLPQTITGTSGNNNNYNKTHSPLTKDDIRQNTTTSIESGAPLSSAVEDAAAATAADAVNSACASDFVQSNGKYSCQELCADRACCFTEGPFSCKEELHGWCLQYSACNILTNDDQQQKTTTTTSTSSNAAVTKACSPAALQLSKAECQDLCDDRACCFAAGSFNCNEELVDWCHEYSACHALIELEEEQQLIPNDNTNVNIFQVDEICDSSKMQQDSLYASQCTKLCFTRSCCFEAKGSDYNCYELNSQWCDEFQSCWNLPQYNDTSPTPISTDGG